MKKLISCSVLVLCFGMGSALAKQHAPVREQQGAPASMNEAHMKPNMRGDGPAIPESQPFKIVKYDSALDKIIAPDTRIELLAGYFGLSEGPVWVPDGKQGYLVVADLIGNVLYRINPDHKVSVFLYKAGWFRNADYHDVGSQTRRGRTFVLMIGPNGTTLDAQGRLVWCAAPEGKLMRLEKDGTRTVLSAGIDGKRFDGPNDVVMKSDGAFYMTDSNWGLRNRANSPYRQLDYQGVFLIKNGKTSVLIKDTQLGAPQPNGIAFSPDEKYLYLSAGHALKRYVVKADDTIDVDHPVTIARTGAGDGQKVDTRGNIYTTSGAAPGYVQITAPTGKILGRLMLPVIGGEPKRQICATNVAFGDPDGKGLYITACENVYKVRLRVPGILPGPAGIAQRAELKY